MNTSAYLALAMALYSQGAFASIPRADEPLEAILENPSVEVQLPAVRLQHEYGTFNARLLSVCIDRQADQVRLKSDAAKVCTSRRYLGKAGSVCRSTEIVSPSAPIVATQEVCAEYTPYLPKGTPRRCVRFVEQVTDYSRPIGLKVRRLVHGRGMTKIPTSTLFTKEYSIPSCQ
jgi:hypothetical protein